MWGVVSSPDYDVWLDGVPDKIKCFLECKSGWIARSNTRTEFSSLDATNAMIGVFSAAILRLAISNSSFLIPKIEMGICDMRKSQGFSRCESGSIGNLVVKTINVVIFNVKWLGFQDFLDCLLVRNLLILWTIFTYLNNLPTKIVRG